MNALVVRRDELFVALGVLRENVVLCKAGERRCGARKVVRFGDGAGESAGAVVGAGARRCEGERSEEGEVGFSGATRGDEGKVQSALAVLLAPEARRKHEL